VGGVQAGGDLPEDGGEVVLTQNRFEKGQAATFGL
jgi:hypothetical protein